MMQNFDFNKEKRKKQIQNILVTISIFSFILFSLIFLFLYFGKVKNIEVIDIKTNKEDKEIKEVINEYIKKQNIINSNFLFLNSDKLENSLKETNGFISKISIKRNLNASLRILIYKHTPFFYSCNDDFIINCALGNDEGVYYDAITNLDSLSKNIFEITVTQNNLIGENNTDTFIGNRILNKEKFLLLIQLKKYFDNKNYKVKKISINNLEIANFYVDDFYINNSKFYFTISLNKSYVDTIKDFETLENSIEIGNIIKNKNSNLKYLDLSFKDKVFYK